MAKNPNRDDAYIKAFGLNLKKLRESKDLSQAALAHDCGFPTSQIGRFERGVRGPTLSTILMLAKRLKIEPKALFDFKYKI